jgi:DNA-binding YbaB/EbfC family protein
MSNLLAQAQAMQNQFMEAQADLERQEIEGSAGGGLVTALVSGTGELLSLDIKKEAVDPDDTETLADLIVAAVRDASENAKEVAARAMGPLAGGLGGFGGEGGFPGLGGGSSAPAGFTLPGASTVQGSSDDNAADDGGDQSAPGESTRGGTSSGGPGATGSTGIAGTQSNNSVGFVNPGSGTGSPGQNQG